VKMRGGAGTKDQLHEDGGAGQREAQEEAHLFLQITRTGCEGAAVGGPALVFAGLVAAAVVVVGDGARASEGEGEGEGDGLGDGDGDPDSGNNRCDRPLARAPLSTPDSGSVRLVPGLSMAAGSSSSRQGEPGKVFAIGALWRRSAAHNCWCGPD